VPLYESLRRSSVRTVLATHELAAAFMAIGHYRASGQVAVLTTIPGPGFTYALTGLAEAQHDSAALLYLVPKAGGDASHKFDTQVIDQQRIAASLVKKMFDINAVSQIGETLTQAYHTASNGEPGPVLVEIAAGVVTAAARKPATLPPNPALAVDDSLVEQVIERLAGAERPILLCGQGTQQVSRQVCQLAELLRSPVATTGSGRGVIPEDHSLSMPYDFSAGAWQAFNQLIDSSDLVLALGCKFSHGGSAGFRMKVPPAKLIHVDASDQVLGANYPAQLLVQADLSAFLTAVLQRSDRLAKRQDGWDPKELQTLKTLMETEVQNAVKHPPTQAGVRPDELSRLFKSLRRLLPRDAILVTDSGQHQVLARASWKALAPRSLLVPSDFQSMGFGLPAAIGASIAVPSRRVILVLGDGCLAMSGMELLTAVRENLPLTILVFNDGKLGLIRLQQISASGREYAVDLAPLNYEMWARSLGANYFLLRGDLESSLRTALESPGVNLIEVRLKDAPGLKLTRAKGLIMSGIKRRFGSHVTDWLKRIIGR